MNHLQKYLATFLVATAALLGGASPAWAQVSLGAASDFALLGGTAITCTAGSVVTGDVGVFPGTAFTNTGCTIAGGIPPGTNAAAEDAREDFLSAYTAIQALSTSCTPVSGNLSGVTLTPGVYCLDAVAKAGTLTLSGNANGVWIFLVNGALTGTDFSVVMTGGGQPCNVFWAPTAAATMTTSTFKGNILAGDATLGSVTLTGGTLAGSVLANIAVTMTGAPVTVIGCDALTPPSPSCKPKKRHGHKKHHGHDKDKHHGHDKDKHHGHDKDKDHGDDDDKDKGHGSNKSPFGKKK